MKLNEQLNLVCFLYLCLFIYLSLRCIINSCAYFHKHSKSIQSKSKKQYIRLLFSNRYWRDLRLISFCEILFVLVIWIFTFWNLLKIVSYYWLRSEPNLFYPALTLISLTLFPLIPLLVRTLHIILVSIHLSVNKMTTTFILNLFLTYKILKLNTKMDNPARTFL